MVKPFIYKIVIIIMVLFTYSCTSNNSMPTDNAYMLLESYYDEFKNDNPNVEKAISLYKYLK